MLVVSVIFGLLHATSCLTDSSLPVRGWLGCKRAVPNSPAGVDGGGDSRALIREPASGGAGPGGGALTPVKIEICMQSVIDQDEMLFRWQLADRVCAALSKCSLARSSPAPHLPAAVDGGLNPAWGFPAYLPQPCTPSHSFVHTSHNRPVWIGQPMVTGPIRSRNKCETCRRRKKKCSEVSEGAAQTEGATGRSPRCQSAGLTGRLDEAQDYDATRVCDRCLAGGFECVPCSRSPAWQISHLDPPVNLGSGVNILPRPSPSPPLARTPTPQQQQQQPQPQQHSPFSPISPPSSAQVEEGLLDANMSDLCQSDSTPHLAVRQG